MSKEQSNPADNCELLPDSYDELVPVEKLVHGEHNPRRNTPSERLKQSIAGFGINKPLTVRPDPDEDVYHVTDGWQRYQAATQAGWEHLPVEIYEDTLEALAATEQDSIVDGWSRYTRATYCCSLATEFEPTVDSKIELAREVASITSWEPDTVRRYLDVLSLPDEVHILLSEGPEGSDKQWAALKNVNEDVRQYGGLQWQVADRLARNQSSVSKSRVVEIAATAVEFETVEQGTEFVDLAVANPEMRVDVLQRKVLLGDDYDRYLVVPRAPVALSKAKKQAVMDYCHQQRRSLSDIVTERIKSLAEELTTDDTEVSPSADTDTSTVASQAKGDSS
jgi:ParB/RepB/Spo0J family partition protein